MALALFHFFDGQGLLFALVLLGATVFLAMAYSALWLRRAIRRERQSETKRTLDLVWLSGKIGPRRPLPHWVGGMARVELLDMAWKLIVAQRPKRVLELGSGLSTLVMAYALEANGNGELIALEDNADHAANTRRLLAEHGLAKRAQVLDAPLRSMDLRGNAHDWYTLPVLSTETPVNLLLVDGPAGHSAPMVRYPALPLLYKHLADEAVILLDDTDRPTERQIADRWLAEFSDLQEDDRAGHAGFSVFHRTSTDVHAT